MNWTSLGEMRKKETFAGCPRSSEGNFSAKSSTARETSSGRSSTSASPVAWIPRVLRQSSEYSSIANETTGFWARLRADVASGLSQM